MVQPKQQYYSNCKSTGAMLIIVPGHVLSSTNTMKPQFMTVIQRTKLSR